MKRTIGITLILLPFIACLVACAWLCGPKVAFFTSAAFIGTVACVAWGISLLLEDKR